MKLYDISKYLYVLPLIFHFKPFYTQVESTGTKNQPTDGENQAIGSSSSASLTPDEVKSKFEKACKYVKSKFYVTAQQGGMTISDQQKLDLYSCYKQATVGDCNTPQPSVTNPRDRAKWTAWKNMKGISKEDAMKAYLVNLEKIKPDWESCYDKESQSACQSSS